MFGLPASTTAIMGLVMGFWVVYTLVFYLSTRGWSVEDADYDDVAASGTSTPSGPTGSGASDAGGEGR